MLYYADGPRGEGSFLNLANAPDGLVPLDYHGDTPETYLAQLRAAYVQNPRPFLRLVQGARDRGFTIVSKDRPDLAETLYRALVGVAESRGWHVAGGRR